MVQMNFNRRHKDDKEKIAAPQKLSMGAKSHLSSHKRRVREGVYASPSLPRFKFLDKELDEG